MWYYFKQKLQSREVIKLSYKVIKLRLFLISNITEVTSQSRLASRSFSSSPPYSKGSSSISSLVQSLSNLSLCSPILRSRQQGLLPSVSRFNLYIQTNQKIYLLKNIPSPLLFSIQLSALTQHDP